MSFEELKMKKIIYKSDTEKKRLPVLLEGYLYGLGEVCHILFGPKGEVAMYQAIGSYFLKYLKSNLNISFSEKDPWKRYCHIIKVFTEFGFYSYVEIKKLSPNSYWMLETGQYAGDVWEVQKSWDRGTPPCPLWSVILHSLYNIGYTIILDKVKYDRDTKGYESTFHFEKITKTAGPVIQETKKELRNALLPVCASCKKIRNEKGEWIPMDIYFYKNYEMEFTHGICKECERKLYPDLHLKD